MAKKDFKNMTKTGFIKRIVISSAAIAAAAAIMIVFGIWIFGEYAPPSENNTSVKSGTVTDVYLWRPSRSFTSHRVKVELSNGDSLQLACSWGLRQLYSAIGYDLAQLADLLEGQVVEYRRMDRLPWVVEIDIGDTKIDNSKLTAENVFFSRAALVILEGILFSCLIIGYVTYLKDVRRAYTRAEKKRARKAQRQANRESKE